MDNFELILLRLKAGLKQYELAQLLGMSPTIVCDLERGRRPVTPQIEKQIVEAISKAKKGSATVSGRR